MQLSSRARVLESHRFALLLVQRIQRLERHFTIASHEGNPVLYMITLRQQRPMLSVHLTARHAYTCVDQFRGGVVKGMSSRTGAAACHNPVGVDHHS